jgi:dephospho-CoA kinase
VSGKAALTIGLTGGIASGKSEVAKRFAELGVPIIDTDEIARELVTEGSQALTAIRATFGPDSVDEQGQLRRDWLRRHIFDDAEARRTLEGILHPLIREKVADLRSRITAPYAIVVAPLLLETGFEEEVDRVLVVDTTPDTQIQRLMARDDVAESDALAALSTQLSREDRRVRADDIVDNNDDLSALDAQIRALHQRYMSLAG